jgi:hypothetical protein
VEQAEQGELQNTHKKFILENSKEQQKHRFYQIECHLLFHYPEQEQ